MSSIFYECQRCTACCRWPGQVKIGEGEITAMADLLRLSDHDFIQQFTRLRPNREGLALQDKGNGECIFLEGRDCRVQAAKPIQCSGFPNTWNFPGWQKVCEAKPVLIPDAPVPDEARTFALGRSGFLYLHRGMRPQRFGALMLSCSTCWNSDRHTDGRPMIREILDLGFSRIELGHGIRLSLMEGIQKLFDKGRFTVSSLHNFCPLPIEITRSSPDCYQFSSPRTSERERAVKLTLQTIEFAARLDAKLIVLHLGTVDMKPITQPLIELAEKGEQFSREYVRRKVAAVQERAERAPEHLQRVKDCLHKIVDAASERGIKLGIEGRYGYEEIPTGSEALALFAEIGLPHVGYWHDFGHIQVKHNLGFLDHYEWLSTFAPQMFGGHLHDCVWPAGDHRVPFSGGIDYDRLLPLFRPEMQLVFEMSPRRKAEEIMNAREQWIARFGE